MPIAVGRGWPTPTRTPCQNAFLDTVAKLIMARYNTRKAVINQTPHVTGSITHRQHAHGGRTAGTRFRVIADTSPLSPIFACPIYSRISVQGPSMASPTTPAPVPALGAGLPHVLAVALALAWVIGQGPGRAYAPMHFLVPPYPTVAYRRARQSRFSEQHRHQQQQQHRQRKQHQRYRTQYR